MSPMDVILGYLMQQESRFIPVVLELGVLNLDESYKPPFVALINAIVCDGLSYEQAKILRSKIYLRCHGPSFTPQTLIRSNLKSIGISSVRIKLLHTVSEFVLTHKLDLTQADEWNKLKVIPEITNRIIIHGQITSLINWDLLPSDNEKIQLGVQKLYALSHTPTEKEVRTLTNKFSPYRTVITWYLWKWM